MLRGPEMAWMILGMVPSYYKLPGFFPCGERTKNMPLYPKTSRAPKRCTAFSLWAILDSNLCLINSVLSTYYIDYQLNKDIISYSFLLNSPLYYTFMDTQMDTHLFHDCIFHIKASTKEKGW